MVNYQLAIIKSVPLTIKKKTVSKYLLCPICSISIIISVVLSFKTNKLHFVKCFDLESALFKINATLYFNAI